MFTTLKALKWSYDLGVRQERTRIAAHLQLTSQNTRLSNEVIGNMLREEMDKPRQNKKNLERLEFQRAVNHRVEEIINELFNPKGEWTPGASLMFPDDEHTGKVK